MDKRKTLIEKSIGKCLYNHRLRRDMLMPKQNRNYKKKTNGIKMYNLCIFENLTKPINGDIME